MPPRDLPVDPDRLRRQFPDLTAEDVDAYVAVTRRILDAPPGERPRITRDALEGGRRVVQRWASAEVSAMYCSMRCPNVR